MSVQRLLAEQPVAILSFQSHSDRSFLDDRELALLSGILSQTGIDNDLIVTAITREMEVDGSAEEMLDRLALTLCDYNPIIYERVWNPELIARLREKVPDKVFIGLRGEHEMLDGAPADAFCTLNAKQTLTPLIAWLRGQIPHPPEGTLLRSEEKDSRAPWMRPESTIPVEEQRFQYAPNLRPIVINPEAMAPVRTFSILGNSGCPYQADARANPLYEGTKIPEGLGRGCAFCVTGNHYEPQPNSETAESVFEQISYVRRCAPDIGLLVLKDQNPFAYLTEVIERCAAEGVTDFSLLLETRAEWFLRNEKRFARALAVARQSGIRIAPFLVGIENFSQPELDRFNKGISAALNIEFLETLWRWKEEYGEALDLSHAAFGFILFTPWTTLADLETNLAGIRQTRLDQLRGSLLLSRVRLYPDTALYYLAERDGLLVEEFGSETENMSRRYGYYPSRPWKHVHADVAHFARIAAELTERNGGRDMVGLFALLLDEFRDAGKGWRQITAESVWTRYESSGGRGGEMARLQPAPEELRHRFARLILPLSLDAPFAGGWKIGALLAERGRVAVELRHPDEPPFFVELVAGTRGDHFRRSRHYLIRTRERTLGRAQETALCALADAIARNDR